jgi:hypothetical protein
MLRRRGVVCEGKSWVEGGSGFRGRAKEDDPTGIPLNCDLHVLYSLHVPDISYPVARRFELTTPYRHVSCFV